MQTKNTKWYDSPKWRRVRDKALRRDKYCDVYLKRYGKVQEAEVVHHIFPREEFPDYEYALWNLISVTRDTHNSFHDRDSDELTEKGRELLRSTARKNDVPIPDRYMEKKKKGVSKRRDSYYT